MLTLGTILSLRASGSNVFCRSKNRQSMLPKRFALRMSWDFACFLFKLRNAGAYIPKGTPCTLHVSTNLHTNACLDILSQSHILRSCYKAVCIGGCHYATYRGELVSSKGWRVWISRCMKKIEEISLLNFLWMDCQKIHSLFTIPAYPSPPPLLACPIVRGPPRRAQLLAPRPHAAMEHPGHARVPTLSMGRVRR